MTAPRFDELIHAPIRLKICVMLATAEAIEFSVLRDRLEVADSVLSKHLKALVDVDYVKLDKPTGKGRVRTWVRLTGTGHLALRGHLAALRAMAASVEDEPLPSALAEG